MTVARILLIIPCPCTFNKTFVSPASILLILNANCLLAFLILHEKPFKFVFMEISQLYQVYLQHPVIKTDTRKIQTGDIFFALKGPKYMEIILQQKLYPPAHHMWLLMKK